MSRTFALVAGGGTAGHLTPALSIAGALVRRGHDPAEIHFVGSRRGLEVEAVPAAGFALTALPGRGIQRRLTVENVGAVLGLVRAVLASLVLVRRLRPAVVVSMGGYASVPCALAAFVWRVPVVVAEQNAVPGAANRLVARFAKAAAVSFPATGLPREIVTGNPVRPEILAVDRDRDGDRARAALDVPDDLPLVLAFGGSLGARRVNEAVIGMVAARPDADRFVHHVIGQRDWDRHRPDRERLAAAGARYRAVEYESAMDRCLAAADLVVCRSGASTVAELAVTGAPAVLVPLPGAPGDHQTANARALADAGAAVLVADGDLDAATLEGVVAELLSDAPRRKAMSAAASSAARPDAADRVAALAEEHAHAR